MMKAAFCFLILFFGYSYGGILSPSGKDTQNLPGVTTPPYVSSSVSYYLYTLEDQDPYQITKDDEELLKSSTFNPSKKTKVLIHGFLNSYEAPIDIQLLGAYLKNQDVNIVVVDWSKLAAPYYNIAVQNTFPVGEEVAQLIDFLVSAGGANVSDVHILGHSLGAHVASFTANHVTSGRITRISGLDPALPSFGDRPPARRLDPKDADIVDVIHTCGQHYGFYEPLGTYDFYANGGVPVQPGCGFDWLGTCSHSRAFSFYASSIAGNTFSAQACASFQEVEQHSCSGEWTGLLGELAPTTPPGLYYLKTTGYYPYAKK